MSNPTPTETPNVVIESPDIRKLVGTILYLASVIAGLATIITMGFPELTTGSVDPNRVIAVVLACISFLSGAFGLGVTRPNIPTSK